MEHNNGGKREYIDISAWNLTKRLFNHRHFFSSLLFRKQTTLSKYFGNLKDEELTPQIKWKIVRQSSTANNFNNRCNLCIEEKY